MDQANYGQNYCFENRINEIFMRIRELIFCIKNSEIWTCKGATSTQNEVSSSKRVIFEAKYLFVTTKMSETP